MDSNTDSYKIFFIGSFVGPSYIKEVSLSYETISKIESYLSALGRNLERKE